MLLQESDLLLSFGGKPHHIWHKVWFGGILGGRLLLFTSFQLQYGPLGIIANLTKVRAVPAAPSHPGATVYQGVESGSHYQLLDGLLSTLLHIVVQGRIWPKQSKCQTSITSLSTLFILQFTAAYFK